MKKKVHKPINDVPEPPINQDDSDTTNTQNTTIFRVNNRLDFDFSCDLSIDDSRVINTTVCFANSVTYLYPEVDLSGIINCNLSMNVEGQLPSHARLTLADSVIFSDINGASFNFNNVSFKDYIRYVDFVME